MTKPNFCHFCHFCQGIIDTGRPSTVSQVMADELAAHIAAVVAAAPPLTEEQLRTIVSLLAPKNTTAQMRTRTARDKRDRIYGDSRAA
ncbi:hypothetical protein [Kribbella sp. CA-294648]|uniref:hypothetical protein n=1 Tax=Kribbella sp. CA-294648 TaxID=3239948 RepID=UPI003D8DD910